MMLHTLQGLIQQGMYFLSKLNAFTQIPFSNHHEFPLLLDAFIRKNNHHLILETDFSPQFYPIFLEAFLKYLSRDDMPYALRTTQAIYLNKDDISTLNACFTRADEDNFKDFCSQLDLENTNKLTLIALSDAYLLSAYDKSILHLENLNALQNLCANPNCRLILFTNRAKNKNSILIQYVHALKENNLSWVALRIAKLTEVDSQIFIRQQCKELEKFHQVVIPDEIIYKTNLLAGRYFGNSHALDQTLLLIDSSAARLGTFAVNEDKETQHILSMSQVLQVLSVRINIPVTHLESFKFKNNDFLACLQEKIFGQELALYELTYHLKMSYRLTTNEPRNVCGFLFAGPKHTGKKTCARVLTEQLFQHTHMLYFAKIASESTASLLDLKFSRHDKAQLFSLKEIIIDCPYAILVIENIEAATSLILNNIEDILSHRSLYDEQGQQYDFQHTLLILNMLIPSKRFITRNQTFVDESEPQHGDLMQLIMNDKKVEQKAPFPLLSTKELIDDILPDIQAYLPKFLTQRLHIIPFLPLALTSIEKIMAKLLMAFCHSVYLKEGLQIKYAPEVLNYLAKKASKGSSQDHDEIEINNTFTELSTTILETLEHHMKHQLSWSTQTHYLFLQLNETGTLLRSEWKRETEKEQTFTGS